MPNLRIISDNALDRAATFAATGTNANYPASNMLYDDKSNSWRTVSALTTNISATWAAPERIGAVVFPICNFTSAASTVVIISTETATLNRILYSSQFDNAAWQKSGGTIAADSILAPDGTTTADRFTANTNDGYVAQIVGGIPTGTSFTASVWAKSTVNRNINLYLGGITLNVAVSTAWQRISVTCPPTAAGSLALQISGGGLLQTGGILDLWGAQLESGLVPTSNYPTTSAAATRPTGYIDQWQSYQYNSGGLPICPAPAIVPRGFTATQALGAYAYGGGACGRVWFPEIAATGIRVYVGDPNNPQGYLDIARAIIAPYWSPSRTISDAPWTMVDTSTHYRTDAGDLLTEAGAIHKKIALNFGRFLPADRIVLAGILRNSRAYPIFVSVFPGATDLALERDYSIYGKRSQDSEIAIQYAIAYSTTVELEEI